MRLTTVKKEASLDALADRLYANLTPNSRKLAVAALVKANPVLAQEGGLRPGVVVTLPDQPGLNLKTAQSDTDPVGTLTDDAEGGGPDLWAPAGRGLGYRTGRHQGPGGPAQAEGGCRRDKGVARSRRSGQEPGENAAGPPYGL